MSPTCRDGAEGAVMGDLLRGREIMDSGRRPFLRRAMIGGLFLAMFGARSARADLITQYDVSEGARLDFMSTFTQRATVFYAGPISENFNIGQDGHNSPPSPFSSAVAMDFDLS